MARKPRVEYPGAIYNPLALRVVHSATSVMNSESFREQAPTPSRAGRGDRREPIFRDDAERQSAAVSDLALSPWPAGWSNLTTLPRAARSAHRCGAEWHNPIGIADPHKPSAAQKLCNKLPTFPL